MQLTPPREGLYEYISLDLLVDAVNKHAKDQGYAVTRKRSKPSKKGVLMKGWIRCDRGGEAKQEGYGHRNTSSKRVDCPFECIAKLQFNFEDEHGLGDWILTVVHAEHNHPPTKSSASVVHRNIAMKDPFVLREIEKEFRKGSKANSVLKGLRLDEDTEGSIFKPRDIWNEIARLRANTLGVLTPTQALMANLSNQTSWYVDYKTKEGDGEREFLFFAPECSQKLLRFNYEVILMDATYKTNKYRMPLLIIIGVTPLNTTFYATLCFMKGENYSDYRWIMEALKRLYDHLHLPYPNTVLFDDNKALAPALRHVFYGSGYRVNHGLCVWHMNNNITTNCKKLFPTNELYDEFMKR